MNILKNDFDVETTTWDDPGDYPCGAGSGPLPSYDYVEAVPGQLVVQLEDNLDDEQLKEIANENADLPDGVTVSEWDIARDGNKVTFEVADFDASNYDPGNDEPDYEPDYDYTDEWR